MRLKTRTKRRVTNKKGMQTKVRTVTRRKGKGYQNTRETERREKSF